MTSWEAVDKWYDDLVGTKGHYYHEHVILPKLIPMLKLDQSSALLDIGCGQGILARSLPKGINYHGVDLSPSLIKSASKSKSHNFSVADACKPFNVGMFTHAVALLSLQNMEHPDCAIKNAANHLSSNGVFICVLNHLCFRIPRQSCWGVDQSKKLQYRRIDRYLTAMKIPIQIQKETVMSFHHSLSDYSRWLYEAGFCIELIEEWISDKESIGAAAKMENRCRKEFPLFLTIKCRKIS